RLLDLLLTDISDLDLAPIQFWNLEEEIPVLALRFAQRRLRHHVDGFQAGLALVLDGTDIDADAASGAVFGRHLDGVLHPLPVFVAHLGGLESRWRACQLFRIVDLDADYSVRADHGAFAALNADLRIPRRNFKRNVALLPLRRAGGKGAIDWKRAHRKIVAVTGVDYAEHIALKLRRSGRKRRRHFRVARHYLRNRDFEHVGQSFIHGAQVLLHHLVAFFPICVA